jgi:AcrR family transcriptional regulator
MEHPLTFKDLDRSLRKQKIIDTAADLFQRKGYSTTTLDDVAKELGVSKAALYHYVSRKDELLSIIYAHTIKNIFMGSYEILDTDLPPNEKLRLFIHNHIKNIIIKSLPMFAVFFSEENQLLQKDYQKIRKEKRKYNLILEEIIKEGISKGAFKKVDVKLQSYAILGMCNWVHKWYKPDQSKYTSQQIADHFADLLETGYIKANGLERSRDLTIFAAGGKKIVGGLKKQNLYKLKRQCLNLIQLIEEEEKSF